ncbi:phage tail protein (plasmid) [Serratia sp. JSRIV002]|uniref:CfaE/CblD family pilus tip adhesin n=1 Tax=Serratia sp. JSRIV002 TaxID=2831894 RepID=UPI001CBD7D96|nr:CfaE/CblD family pilus tip adhesin [Serratia sp. JSRIV002]UAN54642.1 phage tail protein [Serratia sp. JSRIV002]
MKKRHVICLLSALLLCFVSSASAELPTTEITDFSATYDASSVPSSLFIWDAQTKGSGSEASTVTMVCQSTTDTAHGACPDSPVWQSAIADGQITLRFVQDDTHAERDIIITNRRFNGVSNRPVWNAINAANFEIAPVFSYFISQADLRNLTGGVWRATLIMNYRKWPHGDLNATWTANIVLTVTDLNNQQLYFPEFPYAAPQVDLNLSNRPGTANNHSASGSVSLDMCLYDGSNGTSERIDMLFQDEGSDAPGRPDGMFSVYRTGGNKSSQTDRLDYQVSVIDPTTGTSRTVSNGKDISWSNINRRNILRQVVLPGRSGVSLCVPAPITLTTPVFPLAAKAAGRYTGRLKIIYTPSTQSSVSQ